MAAFASFLLLVLSPCLVEGNVPARLAVEVDALGHTSQVTTQELLSEPDYHESVAALAELQQPPISLLAAQSLLAVDCSAVPANASLISKPGRRKRAGGGKKAGGRKRGQTKKKEKKASKAAARAARKSKRAARRASRKAKRATKAVKKTKQKGPESVNSIVKAKAGMGDCSKPHDFVIGIDASNSIGNKNWPIEVDFANSVIGELLGTDGGHRVATYYFAGVATKVSDFSSDSVALQSALSALKYQDVRFGATNHPAGFMLAEKLLDAETTQSDKVHLLITDGKPWKSCKHLTSAEVDALPCPTACQNKQGSCDKVSKKGKPIGEYCKCAMSAAQLFNSKYTTYTVGVLGKKNRIGDDELRGMASSPEFYMPASFDDLSSVLAAVTAGVCQEAPEKSTTVSVTKHMDCDYGLLPGPPGPSDTQLNLCSGDSVVDFSTASVVHNNLGGLGPDTGAANIRYASIATFEGRAVDLLVSTPDPSAPLIASGNGRQGGMGLITMKSGSTVDLKFQLVESGTDTSVVVPDFAFAFLDFDRWVKGAGGSTDGVECLTISGFASYEVSADTELSIRKPAGRTEFCATRFGDRFDNPTNPMNLTAKQANRAVSFQFKSTSEFLASLSVGAQQCGFVRTFMFAGAACLADGKQLMPETTTTTTTTRSITTTTTTTTASFTVVDGCTTEGGRRKNFGRTCKAGGAGATGLAAVRCCSNNGRRCASKRGRSCFGRRKTYEQAVGICAVAGMRLCTEAEVAREICCGTGCMYDHEQVWTSDSCGSTVALPTTTTTTTTTTTVITIKTTSSITTTTTTTTASFTVVDGCTTEGGRRKNFGRTCKAGGAGATGLAAVRCCSNNGRRCASKTGRRCFGRRKTYEQAVGICAVAGMRLCTEAEVAREICCGTGCMYDHEQVWTSDSCGATTTPAISTITTTTTTKSVGKDWGLCATWGDPHHNSFDGALPNWYGTGTYWIVRSSVFNMMGQSSTYKNVLTRVGLTGGELGSHAVVVYQHAVGRRKKNDMRLLLDGKQVLSGGNGNLAVPGTTVQLKRSGYIRPDYHHVRQGNGLWAWFERKWKRINQFVYTISFPDGAEVTAFGLAEDNFPQSRMGVVIKLAREPGLSGMCGNFNDNSRDDCHKCSKQAMERYVSKVSSSDIPAGFLEGASDGALVRQHANNEMSVAADEVVDEECTSAISGCNAALLQNATQACKDIIRVREREMCICDECRANSTDLGDDGHTVEIIELVQANGVVVQEPTPGWCVDADNKKYASLRSSSRNTDAGCRLLLEQVGNLDGVEGAQKGDGTNCEIIYDADIVTARSQLMSAHDFDPEEEQSGSGGKEVVAGASGNVGWKCWAEM